ncbi:Ceramide kinase [Hypsibius exemplaris]|uniref:Ceramide kinase n=1 Tax=Hypsibius exemplaris TaxID=2072580 RepID=A0A1W0WU88_HYPEX|nr:Ceramide kinase [Hypsibius exemplaris]
MASDSGGLLLSTEFHSDAKTTDTSIICRFNGINYTVHISDGALRFHSLPGYTGPLKEQEIFLRNILSAKLVGKNQSRRPLFSPRDFFSRRTGVYDASAATPELQLCVAKRVGEQKWRLKTVVLDFESAEFGERICADIGQFIEGLRSRPKRLMFFINPISGGGQALRLMTRRIIPHLKAAAMPFDYIVTTHSGHAREWILEQPDIGKAFDGLIAVGGDGIFNEILDGVIHRAQDEKITSKSDLSSPTVRVGIIPAGSTDSIGCCIGLGDPVSALIHILLGDHMKLDVGAVFRVQDGSLIKFFCAFLGYGFFSDTLRNSEKHWLRRYLGKTRYMLAGAKTFFLNRAYPGYISYRPAAEAGPDGYPDEGLTCRQNCPVCSEVGEKKSSTSAFSFSGTSDEEQEWQTLDGRFTNVIAVSLCCKSEKSPKGLAPTSHCGDGCLDLLFVKKLGYFRLLNYLISTSRGIGPRSVLGENLHACRAYELVFRSKKPPLDGQLDTLRSHPQNPRPSGTVMRNCARTDIHVKIYCQLIDIFGSGLESS